MIPVPYILLYSYLRSIYYFRMRINLTVSVGLQGSYILTPDPDRLANRRPSWLFSYFSYSAIQLYQDYYSASLGSLSAVNYRAELYMLLYNYRNTLIYLYLDL